MIRVLKTLLVCALIAGAGVGIVWYIFDSEPTAERGGAVRESAMLVEVTTPEFGTFEPAISVLGTVRPARDVLLAPRVAGAVVEMAPEFELGGHVDEGQVLLRLDPADFRIRIAQRRAELEQAQAERTLEAGRVDAARVDLEYMGTSLSDDERELVLREPQMDAADARIEAARAALRQAELDLERTELRAPFAGQIMQRDVELGAQVAAGQTVGRIVGSERYWVIAAVPQSRLRWLRFADASDDPSTATITSETAWEPGVRREGYALRLLGGLEEQTRLARVVIEVAGDRTSTDAEGSAADAPLLIDAFVNVDLRAGPLRDVARLERQLVRAEDTVWVMEEGELSIRDVDVLFEDERHAYLSAGLQPGDVVVTSDLATVRDGAPLRLADGSGGSADAPPGGDDGGSGEAGDASRRER